MNSEPCKKKNNLINSVTWIILLQFNNFIFVIYIFFFVGTRVELSHQT